MSKSVLRGEGFHGVEVCRQKKDGSDIYLSVSTAPLRDSTGRIDGIMSISQDITKQKKGEEQRARLETQLRQAQRMEAIGTLAGGIAHDFNNILAAIMGYTELAIDEVPEGSLLEDNLQQIFQGGKRAADLVKQILTFSRQGDEERSPVQVAPLVKEALKLLRSSLPTTIELRPHIKTGLHDVLADPTQIHQITMNLCTNAAHAMTKDGGILEVDLRQVEIDADSVGEYTDITPGTYLIFTVSDTGHGMSPETLERIFEPYFTTKEKGEGTGMGLSVVHGIVRTYGGTIRAYSEPGKGTTFKVYLPAIKGEARVQGAPILPLPTGKERVLFVDDELPLVDLATQGLERLGYEVTPKTSSVEALEIFKAKPEAFDLVITDMTMPEMTGDRLAREMMAVRPDIAVILCTGYSARISRESAEAMGIKAFVMKPVVLRDLAETVRRLLDEQMAKETPSPAAILIIDDDDEFRRSLGQTLERAGHKVREARDGKEGARLYRQSPTDLIITDVLMPEKEGLELIVELRKEFPGVKIFAVSGGGHMGPVSYLDLAKKLGTLRTFHKPINSRELLGQIRSVLK